MLGQEPAPRQRAGLSLRPHKAAAHPHLGHRLPASTWKPIQVKMSLHLRLPFDINIMPVWGATYYWQVDQDSFLTTFFLIGLPSVASVLEGFGIIS